MKHVVMGTAGHIDHGKTALVKRLSGVDTDRLEEEKRRGMTIELGFAPMTLPSGDVISIVDVPGHEKFIKSMVAGATGIDFVVLVIAADEGIMPQTREHLDILSILNVSAGVVALTKCDLVSDEEVAARSLEIEELLKETPLAGIEILPVSAVSGFGIADLITSLEALTLKASARNAQKLFRLPIDRVFTMTGHGTVVTGTIHGGVVTKGDFVEILPKQLSSRVRGIQVHNKQVEEAAAGDRCALNLSSLDKEMIQRGDVIAHKGKIQPQVLADVSLFMAAGKGGVGHNQRVHAHIGAKEVLARIRLLGNNQIDGGGEGYAQLRFEEPVAAIRGDLFIIRAYSPMITLGGGKILFHQTANRKRFSEESLSAMAIGARGSAKQIVHHLLSETGRLADLQALYLALYEEEDALQRILNELVSEGRAVYFPETGKYASRESLDGFIAQIRRAFEEFYLRNPFNYLMEREQLRSKVFGALDLKDFNALLTNLMQEGILKLVENHFIQYGTEAMQRILDKSETRRVNALMMAEGFALRSRQQLAQEIGMPLPTFESVERFLITTHLIMDLGEGFLVHQDHLKPAVHKIRELLKNQDSITVGEVRDLLAIGRKATVLLLEYLDSRGITERQDNERKPGSRFKDDFLS